MISQITKVIESEINNDISDTTSDFDDSYSTSIKFSKQSYTFYSTICTYITKDIYVEQNLDITTSCYESINQKEYII